MEAKIWKLAFLVVLVFTICEADEGSTLDRKQKTFKTNSEDDALEILKEADIIQVGNSPGSNLGNDVKNHWNHLKDKGRDQFDLQDLKIDMLAKLSRAQRRNELRKLRHQNKKLRKLRHQNRKLRKLLHQNRKLRKFEITEEAFKALKNTKGNTNYKPSKNVSKNKRKLDSVKFDRMMNPLKERLPAVNNLWIRIKVFTEDEKTDIWNITDIQRSNSTQKKNISKSSTETSINAKQVLDDLDDRTKFGNGPGNEKVTSELYMNELDTRSAKNTLINQGWPDVQNDVENKQVSNSTSSKIAPEKKDLTKNNTISVEESILIMPLEDNLSNFADNWKNSENDIDKSRLDFTSSAVPHTSEKSTNDSLHFDLPDKQKFINILQKNFEVSTELKENPTFSYEHVTESRRPRAARSIEYTMKNTYFNKNPNDSEDAILLEFEKNSNDYSDIADVLITNQSPSKIVTFKSNIVGNSARFDSISSVKGSPINPPEVNEPNNLNIGESSQNVTDANESDFDLTVEPRSSKNSIRNTLQNDRFGVLVNNELGDLKIPLKDDNNNSDITKNNEISFPGDFVSTAIPLTSGDVSRQFDVSESVTPTTVNSAMGNVGGRLNSTTSVIGGIIMPLEVNVNLSNRSHIGKNKEMRYDLDDVIVPTVVSSTSKEMKDKSIHFDVLHREQVVDIPLKNISDIYSEFTDNQTFSHEHVTENESFRISRTTAYAMVNEDLNKISRPIKNKENSYDAEDVTVPTAISYTSEETKDTPIHFDTLPREQVIDTPLNISDIYSEFKDNQTFSHEHVTKNNENSGSTKYAMVTTDNEISSIHDDMNGKDRLLRTVSRGKNNSPQNVFIALKNSRPSYLNGKATNGGMDPNKNNSPGVKNYPINPNSLKSTISNKFAEMPYTNEQYKPFIPMIYNKGTLNDLCWVLKSLEKTLKELEIIFFGNSNKGNSEMRRYQEYMWKELFQIHYPHDKKNKQHFMREVPPQIIPNAKYYVPGQYSLNMFMALPPFYYKQTENVPLRQESNTYGKVINMEPTAMTPKTASVVVNDVNSDSKNNKTLFKYLVSHSGKSDPDKILKNGFSQIEDKTSYKKIPISDSLLSKNSLMENGNYSKSNEQLIPLHYAALDKTAIPTVATNDTIGNTASKKTAYKVVNPKGSNPNESSIASLVDDVTVDNKREPERTSTTHAVIDSVVKHNSPKTSVTKLKNIDVSETLKNRGENFQLENFFSDIFTGKDLNKRNRFLPYRARFKEST